MKLSEENNTILMLTLHQKIEEYADTIANKLERGEKKMTKCFMTISILLTGTGKMYDQILIGHWTIMKNKALGHNIEQAPRLVNE